MKCRPHKVNAEDTHIRFTDVKLSVYADIIKGSSHARALRPPPTETEWLNGGFIANLIEE